MLSVFQMYRVVVLPVANTWMSWSLLNKMEVAPGPGVTVLLGLVLLGCILMGTQVRAAYLWAARNPQHMADGWGGET